MLSDVSREMTHRKHQKQSVRRNASRILSTGDRIRTNDTPGMKQIGVSFWQSSFLLKCKQDFLWRLDVVLYSFHRPR